MFILNGRCGKVTASLENQTILLLFPAKVNRKWVLLQLQYFTVKTYTVKV